MDNKSLEQNLFIQMIAIGHALSQLYLIAYLAKRFKTVNH